MRFVIVVSENEFDMEEFDCSVTCKRLKCNRIQIAHRQEAGKTTKNKFKCRFMFTSMSNPLTSD